MPEPARPPLDRVLARPEAGVRSIVDIALGNDPSKPRADAARRRPPKLKDRLSRKVSSLPLPVPRHDWERVLVGSKLMFRCYSGSWRDRHARLVPDGEELPRPVIIYSYASHHPKRYDSRIAVLTGYRQEPLGAISVEDIHAEGFGTIKEFRRYWQFRYPKWGWRPGDMISVVELRPWERGDEEEQGAWLLRQLFEEWL